MRDILKVVARSELRAFDHFGDCRDGRDQESALDCQLEQLGLGVAAREFSDDFLNAFEFRKWFAAAGCASFYCNPITYHTSARMRARSARK